MRMLSIFFVPIGRLRAYIGALYGARLEAPNGMGDNAIRHIMIRDFDTGSHAVECTSFIASDAYTDTIHTHALLRIDFISFSFEPSSPLHYLLTILCICLP